MDIGSKIKKIRKVHCLSQEQFAEELHVTRQTVSNWENNRNYPDMDTLRQISDEYQLSFDELLKDDIEWMGKIDQTRKKAISRIRIIFILILILSIVLAFSVWLLAKSFDATADGDRINTDTNVRMLVSLPDATPSRAITYTIENGDDPEELQDKLDKLKTSAFGRIEGDIPAIFTSESPEVILHFQDMYYCDEKPEKIVRVKLELQSVVTSKKSELKADFHYDNGKITIPLSPESVVYNGDDWYRCGIIVEYRLGGKKYISVSALTLMEKR